MITIGEQDPEFLTEVWVLYGIGMTILSTRFAVRLKAVGFRGLAIDDLFALLTVVFYTMDAATVHTVYYAGTNVEATIAIAKGAQFTPEDIEQFEFGSKEETAAWFSYATLLWCLKGTMIGFFGRMTTGLDRKKFVNYLAITCVISYVAVTLTISFGCWPFSKNYQVIPDPGAKCTLRMQNFLVTVVLNVLTDFGILCVPLPLLWKLKMPVQKKVVLLILLSSGLFVISAAITRVVLTLSANPSALNINRWGVRETIVGIISVNVPALRPMFTKAFWTGEFGTRGSSQSRTKSGLASVPGVHGRYEMGQLSATSSSNEVKGAVVFSERNTSQESILKANPDAVHIQTKFEVAHCGESDSETPRSDRWKTSEMV